VTWDDFVETCQTLGDGMFIATVHGDGRPHLAWVVPGFADGKLWFSTYRSSQKSINLRGGSEVALHWLQRPDALALCRATARLIDDPAESNRLWESGPLPYDLNNFFTGADDPGLLFVELTPTSASIGSLDPSTPRRRWRAGSAAADDANTSRGANALLEPH